MNSASKEGLLKTVIWAGATIAGLVISWLATLLNYEKQRFEAGKEVLSHLQRVASLSNPDEIRNFAYNISVAMPPEIAASAVFALECSIGDAKLANEIREMRKSQIPLRKKYEEDNWLARVFSWFRPGKSFLAIDKCNFDLPETRPVVKTEAPATADPCGTERQQAESRFGSGFLIFPHVATRGDREAVNQVLGALRADSLLRVQAVEVVSNWPGKTTEIRFYRGDDQPVASYIKCLLEKQSSPRGGHQAFPFLKEIKPQDISRIYSNLPSNRLEIWFAKSGN